MFTIKVDENVVNIEDDGGNKLTVEKSEVEQLNVCELYLYFYEEVAKMNRRLLALAVE
jgi:hypothetical protein